MREYRDYQRIRTRQEIVRRAVIVMLVVILAGALLIAARVAHGQSVVIGEPPTLARAYLPIVMRRP